MVFLNNEADNDEDNENNISDKDIELEVKDTILGKEITLKRSSSSLSDMLSKGIYQTLQINEPEQYSSGGTPQLKNKYAELKNNTVDTNITSTQQEVIADYEEYGFEMEEIELIQENREYRAQYETLKGIGVLTAHVEEIRTEILYIFNNIVGSLEEIAEEVDSMSTTVEVDANPAEREYEEETVTTHTTAPTILEDNLEEQESNFLDDGEEEEDNFLDGGEEESNFLDDGEEEDSFLDDGEEEAVQEETATEEKTEEVENPLELEKIEKEEQAEDSFLDDDEDEDSFLDADEEDNAKTEAEEEKDYSKNEAKEEVSKVEAAEEEDNEEENDSFLDDADEDEEDEEAYIPIPQEEERSTSTPPDLSDTNEDEGESDFLDDDEDDWEEDAEPDLSEEPELPQPEVFAEKLPKNEEAAVQEKEDTDQQEKRLETQAILGQQNKIEPAVEVEKEKPTPASSEPSQEGVEFHKGMTVLEFVKINKKSREEKEVLGYFTKAEIDIAVKYGKVFRKKGRLIP